MGSLILSSRNICFACLGGSHDQSSRRSSSSIPSDQPKLPRPVNQNIIINVVPQKTKSTSSSSSSSPRRRKAKKASIAQIERAIGAGTFRDSDPCDMEQTEMALDGILPVTGGRFEGELEKKVRETSEILSSKTQAAFRSSEKRILMVIVQFVLPVWTFFLLVAAGVIKLPFTIPFIDDLLL